MFVQELWRYPVKSMAGERIDRTHAGEFGLDGDRRIVGVDSRGRAITARTHPKLLGLKGATGADGAALVSGYRWDSPEALELVRAAVGSGARLIEVEEGGFDVLPLLVATSGAIAHMAIDGRRLRPNIVVGAVEGLAERSWPGKRLRMGAAPIETVQLRGRCVMTTYDPDTLRQDVGVLRRIAKELDGTMALDSRVIEAGKIRVGDPVRFSAS